MNVESVIAQYQPVLRAFLRSRMLNRADADDVLQDTLTKVLRSLHTLEADDKIEPWLFQIASNALMDYYRRRRREKTVRPEALKECPRNTLWRIAQGITKPRSTNVRCPRPEPTSRAYCSDAHR